MPEGNSLAASRDGIEVAMPKTQVGDNELYYEVRGAGSGLPALLIMGLGADLNGWDRVAPELQGERPLVLLDNRGVGRSAKPKGPYTTAELADDAAAVLTAAGFERAHIIGVSLGGAIAQELVLRHPGRFASLALVATFADLDHHMEETATRGTRDVLGSPMDGKSLLAAMNGAENLKIDPRAIFKFLMPLVFTEEFLKREKQYLREMFERALSHGISIEGFVGQLAAAWSHKALDRLGAIGLPSLVIEPGRDRLVPPAQSRALARAIPGARLHTIPDGVHGLVMEGSAEVSAVLRDWLAEHDRA